MTHPAPPIDAVTDVAVGRAVGCFLAGQVAPALTAAGMALPSDDAAEMWGFAMHFLLGAMCRQVGPEAAHATAASLAGADYQGLYATHTKGLN